MPSALPFQPVVRGGVRAAAGATAAFAAVRVSGWSSGPYPLSAMLAFTPYVLAGAVGVGLAAGLSRDRVALVAAGVSAIALGGAVLPREMAASQPAAGGPELTITTANLLYGKADSRALAEIVARRAPDIVTLQELTDPGVVDLEAAGVFSTVPNRVLGHSGRYDDAGVASRWPVAPLDVGLPSVFRPVAVDVPGYGPLNVVSAHPHPPMNRVVDQQWRDWLAALPGPTGPLAGGIVAGDFNATLDHPQLRRLLDAGWRDAGRERGSGMRPTWHGLPGARLTLDHVLVPPGAAVVAYAIDPLPGSDHRAVTVTLRLPAQRPAG
ncbi:MAG: endonuclease/exonuclease/phosphatase family protein [Solirubrobacteraceae bacterium]|nr:endonuclease/exonuclease/phosphatase family protein [Solirubrobacteraceae bacterium]